MDNALKDLEKRDQQQSINDERMKSHQNQQNNDENYSYCDMQLSGLEYSDQMQFGYNESFDVSDNQTNGGVHKFSNEANSRFSQHACELGVYQKSQSCSQEFYNMQMNNQSKKSISSEGVQITSSVTQMKQQQKKANFESGIKENVYQESPQDSEQVSSSISNLSEDHILISFKLVSLGSYLELKQYLNEHNLRYIDIEDTKGQTLLIKAVHLNDYNGVQKLLKDAREQLLNQKQYPQECLSISLKQEQICLTQEVDSQIFEWINRRNELGYTAAHFSCYTGNIDIMVALKEEGADFTLMNKEKSSGMHIAAQNGSIAAIIFLILIGVDINIKDNENATPLHWASFQGFDQSVHFLLALGASVNERDSIGMTPLYLSAISGFPKIVRQLLFAGADQDITDNKGLTPLFIARDKSETRNNDIAEMLSRTSGIQEYCSIRPIFKPSSKSVRQIVYYLIMYVSIHFSFVFFNYSLWIQSTKVFLLSLMGTLVLLSKFFFLNSWLRNPGYVTLNLPKHHQEQLDSWYSKQLRYIIEQQHQQSTNQAHTSPPQNSQKQNLIRLFLLLKEKQDYSEICAHCCIIKPERSRHCEVCRQCVSVYDHHCPWINNCIGTNNHTYFLFYLICIWINILFILILNIIYISQDSYPNSDSKIQYIDPFEFVSSTYIHTFFISKLICNGISIFLTLIFGLPLTLLLIVQLGNFCRNATTFERYSNSAHNNSAHRNNHISHVNSQHTTSQNEIINASFIKQSFVHDNQSTNTSKAQSLFLNCLQMCYYNRHNQTLLVRPSSLYVQ